MMDVRVRSPAIPRKEINAEEASTNLAKKSKRSKSSETILDDNGDSFSRLRTEKFTDTDPLEMLNKRWSIIAKTQDSMSKQEILQSYRLLMNDHLRLERFLSILTRDNEMARNRLETDLLDAMMCIEDLKQALEIRMARRRKIDPREAEERRALIRQNKKLLNQLYESAKKIEHLELTKLEMKEQLELLDFQMMEVENQKAIIEEELRRQPTQRNNESQTDEDPDYGPSALEKSRSEVAAAQSELYNQKTEFTALLAKYHHLEILVRDLRRDNCEIREQLLRSEDTENSLAESDKHIQHPNIQLEIRAKDEVIARLQEKIAKLSDEAGSGDSRFHDFYSASLVDQGHVRNGMQSDLFDLPMSTALMQPKLDGTRIEFPSISEKPLDHPNSNNIFQVLMDEIMKCRSLCIKDDAKKNSTLSIKSDADLIFAIRNLRIDIEKTHKKSANIKSVNSSISDDKEKEADEYNTPEYFKEQFNHLQSVAEASALQAQLAISEKRRADLENRVSEMALEVTRAQTESRSTDTALTASRRTEAALRRRLLATMDTGSTRGRNRPASTFDFGHADSDGSTSKEEFDIKANIIKLEALNAALSEANQLDRVRLQQQAARIAHLEAEHRALHDRMSNLQASESCAQRAAVRLQALYEDMLREYSEASAQDASLRRRRRHLSSKHHSNRSAGLNKSMSEHFQETIHEASNLCQEICNLREELDASTLDATIA